MGGRSIAHQSGYIRGRTAPKPEIKLGNDVSISSEEGREGEEEGGGRPRLLTPSGARTAPLTARSSTPRLFIRYLVFLLEAQRR